MKKTYLLLILLLSLLLINIHFAFSQFVVTGGPTGGSVNCMAVYGQNVYAGTSTAGVSYSTNNGTNWIQINNGLTTLNVQSIAVSGSAIFAGTGNGVFRTTNNGANWTMQTYGGTGTVSALTFNGTDIWLGNSAGSIYTSTNSGANWALNPAIFNGPIGCILFANNNIYAATSGMFISTNNGINWSYQPVTIFNIKSLYAFGSVIRGGALNGGFKSTSPLGSWVQELPWSNYILAFGGTGSYVLEGGSTGIFWSSDNGTVWHDPNSNFLVGVYILSMTQNSTYLFAGTGSGVYRRPISEINSLTPLSTNIPNEYFLGQNYPNPFNPSTVISFAIPKSGYVILRVYNELGQQVAELVNQKLDAGTFEYSFDASAYPSGIFCYILSTEGFSESKKMVLVK